MDDQRRRPKIHAGMSVLTGGARRAETRDGEVGQVGLESVMPSDQFLERLGLREGERVVASA
jgi:hypothetical protein